MLALAAGLALLTGCASAQPAAVAYVRGYRMAVYVSPGVSGENNDVRVDGGRLPGARLAALAVGMPDMGMPPHRVVLTRQSDGSYLAQGIHFSMGGTWRVSILGGANGRHQLAAVEIPVR